MAESLHVVCPHCDKTNRVPRARLSDRATCGNCHHALFEGKPLALDDPRRFARHSKRSDLPLLVDFWAAWCGPCRAMAPILEQATKQLEPKVRTAKVDSDAAPELAARFAVRSIPTLLLIRHGREIARAGGVMPMDKLVAWTRQHIDKAAA